MAICRISSPKSSNFDLSIFKLINFPRSKLWLIDFEVKFSGLELWPVDFEVKFSRSELWLDDFEVKFSRLKLWLIDFEINLSRSQLWFIDIEINLSRSTYRFPSIFLSFKTLTRRFSSKISLVRNKEKDRNRLWIWRNYLLNIVYVESDTKFRSLILERNVRVDSWKKRIHYGKFDVLLGSSSHLSFLHDWCTARVSFELCPIRKTEFPTIHETSFEGGLEKQFNKTCLTLIRVSMLSKLLSCCLNNNETSYKYN